MSLFEDKTPSSDPNQETADHSQAGDANPVDQLLDSIKNENGERKYKSVEDALKGAAHAQSFIENLKKEKAEMERQLEDRKRLEELLADKSNKPDEQAQADAKDQVAGLSQDDVVRILEQREAQSVAETNAKKVKEAAKAAFGAEYTKVLAEKTEALGLSRELADSMAQKSPEALLKLLGVEAKVDTSGLVDSKVAVDRKPTDKKEIKKFNPFNRENDPLIRKWREVGEHVKDRKGQN